MNPRAIAAAVTLIGVTAACGGGDEDDVMGDVREATLSVLPGWSEVYPDATGSAEVSTENGTTVELTVAGLEGDTDYTAHLHDAGCEADPPGGAHWLADPDAGDEPSNEIQLSFTTGPDGTGSSTTPSELVADGRALSIVVHADDTGEHAEHQDSDRVLCGNLGLV